MVVVKINVWFNGQYLIMSTLGRWFSDATVNETSWGHIKTEA